MESNNIAIKTRCPLTISMWLDVLNEEMPYPIIIGPIHIGECRVVGVSSQGEDRLGKFYEFDLKIINE